MIKAILLVFDPVNTWDDIAQDRREVSFILFFFLLPLLVVTCGVEGYGMLNWGKWVDPVAGVKQFKLVEIIVNELLHVLLSLLVIFVGAKLLKSLGETFHGRHTFTQAFRAVAYGLSPMFLLRMLDAFPSMHWWVAWGIGMVLSVAALYHGIPRVMEPDPPHAFGLYLTSSLLLALAAGLADFLAAWWMMGRFVTIQTAVNGFVVTNIVSHLHH